MPHLPTYFPFDLKQTLFCRCHQCSMVSYVDVITANTWSNGKKNFAGLLLCWTSSDFVIYGVYLLDSLMQFDPHQNNSVV